MDQPSLATCACPTSGTHFYLTGARWAGRVSQPQAYLGLKPEAFCWTAKHTHNLAIKLFSAVVPKYFQKYSLHLGMKYLPVFRKYPLSLPHTSPLTKKMKIYVI